MGWVRKAEEDGGVGEEGLQTRRQQEKNNRKRKQKGELPNRVGRFGVGAPEELV